MGYSIVPLTESEIKHSEICPCPLGGKGREGCSRKLKTTQMKKLVHGQDCKNGSKISLIWDPMKIILRVP